MEMNANHVPNYFLIARAVNKLIIKGVFALNVNQVIFWIKIINAKVVKVK